MEFRTIINSKIIFAFLATFLLCGINVKAQKTEYPLIGAQVFIEPGQTDKDIEGWFKTLAEHNMSICRIRMYQSHVQNNDGSWDYSLYDKAFDEAKKYNIKVFATLFPAGSSTGIGGFKFPTDDKHAEKISEFIASVVNHFKDHPSLYNWVLINEIGRGRLPLQKPYTKNKFEEWKKQNPEQNDKKEYGKKYFPEERFFRQHNTNYLTWLAEQVRLHDKKTYLHVNTHGVHYILPQYDFQAWKAVLSSHGASMHPSWHFGEYFKREQYPLAVAFTNDIVRHGGEGMPYWVTELQGGNNTYSGVFPFCPSKEEIAQWLWSSVTSGAEGIIFWTLNPRAFGSEAGEWAMIDFQNNPSDRLTMAGAVAKSIIDNKELFKTSEAVTAKIHLVYSEESYYTEKKYTVHKVEYEGRKKDAGLKSIMTCYKTLIEAGVNPNICDINNFPTDKTDYTGEVLIIANQIALSEKQWDIILNFVSKGGKLIATGLSGYYNDYCQNVFTTGKYPKEMFGAEISEVKLVNDIFPLQIKGMDVELPCHLWQGYLKVNTAEVIAEENGVPVGVRNKHGKGEIVWLPSLAGLGARISDDKPLSKWLRIECEAAISNTPFYFEKQNENIVLKVLDCGSSYVTTITNTNDKAVEIEIANNIKTKEPQHIFSVNKQSTIKNNKVYIEANDVLVISWKKK